MSGAVILGRRHLQWALLAGLGLATASCATAPPQTATKQFERCRAYSAPLYRGAPDFDEWKARVRSVARRCGIGGWTVSRALSDVTMHASNRAPESRLDRTRRLIASLPSARPAQLAYAGKRRVDWRSRRRGKNAVQAYLDRRLTPEFVEKGRELMEKHRGLLKSIETRYGIPAAYLVAYWGIETNYGSFTGNHEVIGTLSRLGYRSSRRRFFSEELLAALIILDRRYAARRQLYGSFAGAMGQPQFMPSSYLYYAVDHNGDGRRDIWSTPGDIFASVANYNLKRGEWNTDYNHALLEVRLPRHFPYGKSGMHQPRPIAEWRAMGIKTAKGEPLPDLGGDAAIYLPGGCAGPAFLLNGNFKAIMRYNNLIEYGFAVSVLAEKIKGDFALATPWPEGDAPLTKTERARLQIVLTRLGYGNLKPDGVLGENTRAAIQRYQRRHRMCADGHANLDLYDVVRGRKSARRYAARQAPARVAQPARQVRRAPTRLVRPAPAVTRQREARRPEARILPTLRPWRH